MKDKNERIIEVDGKKIDITKLSNEDLLKVAKYTLHKIKKTKKELAQEIDKLSKETREIE